MALEKSSGSGSASLGAPAGQTFEQAVNHFLQVTVPRRVDLVKRYVGFDLFGRVVPATPRDTGWAQGSWHMTRDKVDLSVPLKPDPGEQVPAPTPDISPSMDVKSVIYISNNLDYIVPLNQGHSQQAPAGFVDAQLAASITVYETIVRQVVANDGGL